MEVQKKNICMTKILGSDHQASHKGFQDTFTYQYWDLFAWFSPSLQLQFDYFFKSWADSKNYVAHGHDT